MNYIAVLTIIIWFEYADPKNNDVSFYEYRDSKELFNAIKSNEIRFDESRWVVK